MNDTKSLVEKQSVEIGVYTPKEEIKTHDENISDLILREGEWVAFDFVRKGLGDRDIFGTKVFFETLSILNFIVKNDKGEYIPTDEALEKYPQWFVKEETSKKWGLRPSCRGDFEVDYISTVYSPLAVQVMLIFKQDKKDKASARAKSKRKQDEKIKKLANLGGKTI